jgi:uncharacterized protein
MRLVLDSDATVHTVRRYQAGEIIVGERRLTGPCILSARQLITDWGASASVPLREEDLAPLLQLSPAIVLLGWAEQPQAPEPELRRTLAQRGIAVECMNLGAACRTYNVLVQEGRPVAAGLFP